MTPPNAAAEHTLPLLDRPEWQVLSLRHPNVLIEGTAEAIIPALSRLRPHLREPAVRTRGRVSAELLGEEPSGVILEDVAELSGADQARLLAWLDDAGGGRQVISTAEEPLFAHVIDGRFDSTLYYRLNVMRLLV